MRLSLTWAKAKTATPAPVPRWGVPDPCTPPTRPSRPCLPLPEERTPAPSGVPALPLTQEALLPCPALPCREGGREGGSNPVPSSHARQRGGGRAQAGSRATLGVHWVRLRCADG